MHGRTELGEIEGFFGSSIPRPDNGHFFITEEKAVAYCTGADAISVQPLFALQSQPFGAGAGSDNDGIGLDEFILIDPHLVRGDGKIDPGRQAIADIGAHAGGLFFKMHHHLRPLNAVGVTGIVLYLRRDRQLTTRLYPLVKHGFEVGPRSIDGGSIAGRPRSYNKAMYFFSIFLLHEFN